MPALAWMSAVLRGGYRLLKGDAEAAKLFALTLSKMPAPRLSDDQVLAVAEGVVCDWVAARRLVSRGELVAARRCLHLQLNESNLALLHELRQRQGRISFLVGERWHWPPLGLRAQ